METDDRWPIVCGSWRCRGSRCGKSRCAYASTSKRAPSSNCTNACTLNRWKTPHLNHRDNAMYAMTLLNTLMEPIVTLLGKWKNLTTLGDHCQRSDRQKLQCQNVPLVSKLPINHLCQHRQQRKQRQRYPLLCPIRLQLSRHRLQLHQQTLCLKFEFFPKHQDAQYVTLEW